MVFRGLALFEVEIEFFWPLQKVVEVWGTERPWKLYQTVWLG